MQSEAGQHSTAADTALGVMQTKGSQLLESGHGKQPMKWVYN